MNPLEDKEALKRLRAYKRLFMKILNESEQDRISKNGMEGLFFEMYLNYITQEHRYHEQEYLTDLTKVTLAVSKQDGEIVEPHTFLNSLNYNERKVDIQQLNVRREADRELLNQIYKKWHMFTA